MRRLAVRQARVRFSARRPRQVFPTELTSDKEVEGSLSEWRRMNGRGASKIKLKNVNKKRMATARRLIFLEFLRASIADLITLFFSLLQNSEGGGDSDSSDSFADPCQFLPFPKTKI